MNIIRYINGKKVHQRDLRKYLIESDAVLRTIKTVNNRATGNFHQ